MSMRPNSRVKVVVADGEGGCGRLMLPEGKGNERHESPGKRFDLCRDKATAAPAHRSYKNEHRGRIPAIKLFVN